MNGCGEKQDNEIERNKGGLRDKTAEYNKLLAEFEMTKSKFGTIFEEAAELRTRCALQVCRHRRRLLPTTCAMSFGA